MKEDGKLITGKSSE